jgi:predicted DNA-binding transcriptional regulator YafY
MLLKILFLLLSRKQVSAKYIAERYDLSLRTVYRYIDELSLSDIPIYNERGRNGGYSISDTFKIPANFLTAEESEKIISTLTQLNNELGSSVIESAIAKIGSISKISENGASINLGNLVIDGTSWGTTDRYSEILKILQNAIEDKTLIEIDYVDRDGNVSTRIIEPHILALKQGLWYSYSYCRLRNEFRLFKVGRIQEIRKVKENFSRREIVSINEIFEKWYAETPEDIDLLIDKSARLDFEEWLGVDKIKENKNGEIIASTMLPINDYLAGKILSFGDKVKVLAPNKLKKLVIDKANAIAKLYK